MSLGVLFSHLEMRIDVDLVCSLPTSNIVTSYKVMTDGGSCMNIITKSAVDRMNLKGEPPSQLYNVIWVDKTTQSITQRCLVSIQFLSYHDCI